MLGNTGKSITVISSLPWTFLWRLIVCTRGKSPLYNQGIMPQALSIWCKNFFTILSILEGEIRSRTDKKRSRKDEKDLSLVADP